MNNPDNQFEKRIKQALENYQVPYQPDDWLLMQEKLDRQNEKERPKFFIFPYKTTLGLLSVFFAVVIGTAGIGFQHWNQSSEPLTAGKKASSKTEMSKEMPLTATEHVNETVIETDKTTVIPTVFETASFDPIVPVSNGVATFESTDNFKSALPENMRVTSSAIPAQTFVSKPVDNQPLPVVNPFQFVPAIHSISGKPVMLPLPDAIKSLQNDIVPELSTEEETETSAPAPQLPARLPLITLSAHSAADANTFGNNDPVTAGISSGLMVSYRLNKHFRLSAGAMFSHKNLKTNYQPPKNMLENTIVITDYSNMPENIPPQQSVVKLNMVEIPLSVQYLLLPNKKFSPYIRAGVSAYLPFKNMVNYYRSSNGVFVQSGAVQTILSDFPYIPSHQTVNPGNNVDPLLQQPIIQDLENTDLPNPFGLNNPLQNYWINSLPDYQTNLTANQFVQIEDAPGINRPIWDVVHLSLGMNYQINRSWGIMAETQMKGTLMKHRFDTKLPVQLQPQGGQRLYSASLQLGVSYSFK